MKQNPNQLELPLPPRLKLVKGLGQKKVEKLDSRDAVARVLMEAGADLLLRRISPIRAETIEQEVEEILALFDAADTDPKAMPLLAKKLDDLEALMRETRERRTQRAR